MFPAIRAIRATRAAMPLTLGQTIVPAVRSISTTRVALGKAPLGEIQGKPVKNYYVNENGEMVIKVKPLERTGESVEQKRKRLLYQSRKRGILETDILLSRFADRYLEQLSEEQLDEYDKLLDEVDWDIYYWSTGDYTITPLPDKWKNSSVLKLLQDMSKNEEKEVLRMPDLK